MLGREGRKPDDMLYFRRRIWQKKTILLCEIAVIILYGLFLAFTYSHQEFVFEENDMQLKNDTKETVDGNYLDVSFTGVKAVVTPAFQLKEGIYYLEALYTTRGIVDAGLIYETSRNGQELVDNDEFILRPGGRTLSYRMKIHDDSKIRFKMRLTGDAVDGDYVQLFQVRIVSSKLTCVYKIFWIAVFFLVGDLVVLGYRKYYLSWDAEQKCIFIVLVLTAFFMGLPLYRSGLNGGSDLTFHLSRLEGLYRGLRELGKDVQFPVRIQPGWLEGNGYAVSVFYGDLFLYFPAALRLIGFTLEEAYKIYVEMVNIATVFLSYYAFRKITQDDLAAMLGSVLYAGSVQRLTLLYTAVLGSASSMAFYPLIVAGFYLLFTEEIHLTEYKKIWILLAAGFTGLLMTHMLSCLMVGACSFLLCILMIKKVIRRKTLWELFKAAGITVLLNLWYLIPLLQYMTNGKLRIGSKIFERLNINDYYVQLSDFTQEGRNLYSLFADADMIGFSMLIVFSLYIVTASRHGEDKRVKNSRFMAWMTLLAFVVCTDLFPVVRLARASMFLTKFFLTLQYQYRLMNIAVVLAASLAALFFSMGVFDRKMLPYIMGVLCFVTLYQDLLYFQTLSCDNIYLDGIALEARVNNEQYSFHVGNGEYLPIDTDTQQLTEEIQGEEQLQIGYAERKGLSFELTVDNPAGEEHEILFPVLYYDGYQAIDLNTRKKLSVGSGNNGRVMVAVPAGYDGTFRLEYHEPVMWRCAEVISIVTLLAIIIFLFRRKD